MDASLVYTGVGSRATPVPVLRVMREIAGRLANLGWVLRSGGAEGADTAFEQGAGGRSEIYLPWRGFNRNSSRRYGVGERAEALAAQFHPAWDLLTPGGRKLHGRNAYQVLGNRLDKPSRFIACWTPDAVCSAHQCSRQTGGTATAIRIGDHFGVPIFNLRSPVMMERLLRFIEGQEAARLATSHQAAVENAHEWTLEL